MAMHDVMLHNSPGFDIRDFALAGVLTAVGAAAGASTYSRGQLERRKQRSDDRKQEDDRVSSETALRDQHALEGLREQMRGWHAAYADAEATRRTIAAEAAHPDRELEQAFSADALRHPDEARAIPPEVILRDADARLAALLQQGRQLKARYDGLSAGTQDPQD